MIRYIYICAAGHSGSTLLDLVLGSHSRVESLGEISHLSKNISLNTKCSCGQDVLSCNFWSNIIDRLEQLLEKKIRQDPYSLHLGYPNPAIVKDRIHSSFRYKMKREILLGLSYLKLRYNIGIPSILLKPVTTAIQNNILLYNSVLDLTQKEIIVDSSKDYLKGCRIYLSHPKHTKIILLSRDGRGVLYSNLKRKFDRKKSIVRWRNYYSRCLGLIHKYVPDQDVIYVKYENFVKNPADEIALICERIGVDFEQTMLDFASHVHHITNSNDMKFSKSSVIRADLAWRENLSTDDYRTFERIAGEVNRELDYH